MNRHSVVLLLVVVGCLLISTASATNLPPFTSSPGVVPNVLGSLPPGSLVATTGTIKYSFGVPKNPTKNTGTLTESVYRDSHGFLFFVFQIQVTKGDIKTISTGDWENSIKIDAEETKAGGTIKVTGVDRNGYGTIDFNFYNPLILAGKKSYDLILYTNAKLFTEGAIGLIDSGSSPSISAFVAATPEPGSLSLLAIGMVGSLVYRKRHCK